MGTLVCRAELNKELGIILTVENSDDQITQTIVLDGTSITTTVEGPDETSTITQKQDSIAIRCKTFTLDADTITCTSAQKALYKSNGGTEIASGAGLLVSAGNEAHYKAGNSTLIESTTDTVVKGLDLKLSATAGAEMDGATIKISSKGLLDLISTGVATLDGSVVNIKKKSIVNIG